MELDEMKSAWASMSEHLKKQELLTEQLIFEMTQRKFKNKFSKLSFYESIGGIICIIAAIYLSFNFYTLDTWYLKAFGIFSILYLLILPLLVLNSLAKISSINLAKNTYKQTLIEFGKRKKRMLNIQKAGIFFNFVFMIVLLPVISKIFKGRDLLVDFESKWLWFLLVVTIVMIIVSKWGYSKYKKLSDEAQKILKDLNEESGDM